MPNWYNNTLGFISQPEWLDVGFNVRRTNDPVDQLFGDQRTDNLMATWQTIANEYQIPLMAEFHAFDVQANKTFREPVTTHNIEKGLIKVKLNQSERMRALMRTGVREDALYDYVVNDGVRLADQVATRSKVAKNALLATGVVTIKDNGLDLTVNYGVKDTQTGFTIDFAATADVGAQIEAVIDAARAAGVTINGIYTSNKNLSKMRKHVSIQKAINGTGKTGAIVRKADLLNYLSEEYGINTVLTNDEMYRIDSKELDTNGNPKTSQARYYPEDKITFFATNPGGSLGTGLWGDPPETDAVGFMRVAPSGAAPFVYVSQWAENDPAVLWTKASALFMPVLYNPDSLWIATATDTSAT